MEGHGWEKLGSNERIRFDYKEVDGHTFCVSPFFGLIIATMSMEDIFTVLDSNFEVGIRCS
jgi:hypothetical protein